MNPVHKIYMKFIITIAIILSLSLVRAQTEKEKVEAAVRNYVDAFYNADTSKIHKSIAKDIFKYGYAIPKNKTEYERYPMTFQEMISSIVKWGKFPKQNPKLIEVFDVLDKTASAKLTAGWGIDYILLAKQNGEWMITHVLWQSHPPKN
jgi:ketosteroid isomerase-like protein